MQQKKLTALITTLAERLMARQLKVATAESCTGGGLSYWLTSLPGSSVWFDCGFVTYSNAAKQQLLSVKPETLATHGAVSEAVVREMVQGALRYSSADIAIAISGIAGPDGGTPDKPVGTVWLAWGNADIIYTELLLLGNDRQQIRDQSIQFSVERLIAFITE